MTPCRTALAVLVFLLTTSGFAVLLSQQPATYKERDFLTRVRRLTVEGRRAGEGYWSPDGKQIAVYVDNAQGQPDRLEIVTADDSATPVVIPAPGNVGTGGWQRIGR